MGFFCILTVNIVFLIFHRNMEESEMISRSTKREIMMDYQHPNEKCDLVNGNWTFEYGYKQFERYCRIKNLREKTIKDYNENYFRFVNYMKECSTHTITGSITAYDIDNYILYLRNTGMKETSVNTYLRGLRTVINFFIKQKACNYIKIPIYKADKTIKETYTDDELYRLLVKPSINKCSFTEYRNWCIINFFLATGVRVSTLINIKIGDLDFDFDRIHLMYTKSRKSYIIPMSHQIKDILQEYLMFRKGNDEDYLFCNQYGEQSTTDSIKHAITKYNKDHGVNRTSLQAFRHTFAKKCVLNNVNVFVLQRLLGHTDIKITKEYVDLYADDLAVNIDKYNPLDTFQYKTSNQKVNKTKKSTRKRIEMKKIS